ncbi:unnamed protein product, partial [Brugia pahangi]|uniref:CENP-V/GFA domain-containing protein n=1 Tax=Brugia pahangi TaxID=6280 RepID=A0A0N4TCG0_BRUPA
GFCVRCGHYLVLPPGFTAAQRTAAVELHALDWCPRACAAVINERQVKRRRLDLVGREEDARHLFIPAVDFFQANDSIWHSSRGHLSLPAPALHSLLVKAVTRPRGLVNSKDKKRK